MRYPEMVILHFEFCNTLHVRIATSRCCIIRLDPLVFSRFLEYTLKRRIICRTIAEMLTVKTARVHHWRSTFLSVFDDSFCRVVRGKTTMDHWRVIGVVIYIYIYLYANKNRENVGGIDYLKATRPHINVLIRRLFI